MPDIRIHREHKLGLAEARKIAGEWACEVESRFGMACSTIQGETSDTVEFTRSGVKGRLIVAADHFDLDAKLGFLLGAFSRTIETEIEKNLDTLLASHGKARKPPATRTAAAKAPARETGKPPAARKVAKAATAGGAAKRGSRGA
ncbi:MAG: polyhydroxyalkanoic acid system family protein [Burkholderiaceae bacterium]|nr:polyhydroxyalkanoic acid system family protein [Burkholderiaceae bacterium]